MKTKTTKFPPYTTHENFVKWCKTGETNTTRHAKPKKQSKVTFTFDDVSELYHIICNRGFCSTRAKLLIALDELDADLAKRVRENDEKAFPAA